MSVAQSTTFIQRRHDARSMGVVVVHLTVVMAPVFIAATTGTWQALVICYLWFGLTQNGIANLMHEAAHRMIFRKARWSDVLGQRILAPFFLTNFELYRRRHWVHHRHAGMEHDTKETYLTNMVEYWGLLVFVVRCFAGIEAVRRFAATLRENKFVAPLSPKERKEGFVNIILFHLVLGLSLFTVSIFSSRGSIVIAFSHTAIAYCVVYVYGMMSLTILLSTLRAVAEHQIVANSIEIHGAAAIRNLSPTMISRALFGSYGFCEHGTHHSYPTIPYYNLSKATLDFSASRPALRYGPSYWGVISQALAGQDNRFLKSVARVSK
jgi:fatty acid desaturase